LVHALGYPGQHDGDYAGGQGLLREAAYQLRLGHRFGTGRRA
jgi:hypothetical protein